MNVYIIMFVLLYMFIFWLYLPHMSENMSPLSEPGLLNMMSSNSVWVWFLAITSTIPRGERYSLQISYQMRGVIDIKLIASLLLYRQIPDNFVSHK
jgi:hypothetical protein